MHSGQDTNFPNQSILVLGLAFLVIVYALPNGFVGRIDELRARLRKRS